MDANERIKKLETEMIELKYQLKSLISLVAMNKVPQWAKDAVSEAESSGIVQSSFGNGLDYYIILDLLHKKKLL